jgi:hypothetical protein
MVIGGWSVGRKTQGLRQNCEAVARRHPDRVNFSSIGHLGFAPNAWGWCVKTAGFCGSWRHRLQEIHGGPLEEVCMASRGWVG